MISTQRSRRRSGRSTTPPWWSRSTRSSTAGRPFGIFRKSPRPSSFWPSKSNGQWSVPTSWRSSVRRPRQRSSQWSFGRSGGEQTYFAPSNPLPRSSSDRKRYCGHVSAKTVRPAVAGGRHGLQRVARREVDDVDRDAGRLGQADARGWSPRPRRPGSGPGRGRSDRSCRRPRGRRRPRRSTGPFSACIRIRPPFFARLLHRPEDVVVGLKKTPG